MESAHNRSSDKPINLYFPHFMDNPLQPLILFDRFLKIKYEYESMSFS